MLDVDTLLPEMALSNEENPKSAAGVGNAAYVIYTSGSTGLPKGVVNTHMGIVNRLLWMQKTFNLTSEDRVLQKTPYSFDVSVWEFFWPLMTGAALVLTKPGGHCETDYLTDIIESERITVLHFVPSILGLFLEGNGLERTRSLRDVIVSGEALSHDLQQRFFERMSARLHNLYGPTEATVDVTHWECQRDSRSQVVPIGRPVANTQIHILDEKLNPMPVGETGELHIGGIQVARGYLNKPELTEERFIPDPFQENSEGRLYKSGDLARWLPEGVVEYLGRTDFQLKIRGFRIELGEIEEVIAHDEAVRQCVVVARDVFQAFLDEAARTIRPTGKWNLLVLDNASWHKTKSLDWHFFEPLYLPPYSSDFNPIEPIWLVMKSKWFANIRCKDQEALIQRADKALLDLIQNPEDVAKTTASNATDF